MNLKRVNLALDDYFTYSVQSYKLNNCAVLTHNKLRIPIKSISKINMRTILEMETGSEDLLMLMLFIFRLKVCWLR